MTPQEALQQIANDLGRLSLETCGSTSKLSLTGRNSTGSTSPAPKDYGSAQIEAEGLLIRCAAVIRQRIRGAIEPGEDYNSSGEYTKSPKAKIRKAIVEDPVSSPKELAFLFDLHEDSIRRIRRETKQSDEQREALTRAPAEILKEMATNG